LNNLQKQAALNDKKLAELNKQSDEKTLHINDIIEEISKYNYELSSLKEDINRKSITLKDLEERYEIKHEELLGAQNVKDNSLDKELNDILENYYQKNQEKGILEKELASYKNQKDDIFFKINEIEKENKDKNTKYNKKIQELKEAEIKLGKVDVKLDTLLNSLSETYNLTYEKARANYHLDMAEDLARNSIIDLKRKIQSLGNVNLGAIEEFERINTRYTFLDSQKQDLVCSVESLNTAIKEMDEIMKNKFLETFEIVNKEFNTVYKQLFKGGDGRLKLTDPDNLLETGIEIIAQPPGKKMNSIGLLSGGEKTLTAISLLFAILNVKPVPFVILDEVEAALDDANVETFGTYLLEKKEKSQFIIITHKKKTMEYADVLYGITMQESGVSKLVSVKLENI
jgi:chromosome segregation protein